MCGDNWAVIDVSESSQLWAAAQLTEAAAGQGQWLGLPSAANEGVSTAQKKKKSRHRLVDMVLITERKAGSFYCFIIIGNSIWILV